MNSMRIALNEEHEQLRAELRAYFAELVTPEVRAGLALATNEFDEDGKKAAGGEFGDATVYKDVIRQIGQDGWLGIGWPEEYGGQNRSMMEQLIFTDEAAIAGVPIPYLTLNTVGPTIMRFGTDAQKEEILPKILKGEMHFSIGYSEPGSGRSEEHTSELQSHVNLVCRLLLEKKKKKKTKNDKEQKK